jgi:hypothetical protein
VPQRGQRATHIATDGAKDRDDPSSGLPQEAQACESIGAG